jgi:hypothetical protein
MLMLHQLKMTVRSWFAKQPTKKLTYKVEDYKMGKRWAKSQPHPYLENKTLWEHVYDKRETVFTIDNINKYLFSEM